MKRRLLAIVASVAVASCAERTSPTSASGVAWVKDYEQGLAQAKSSNKPVYLDFGADW